MMKATPPLKTDYRPYLIRLAIVMVISTLIAIAVNEGTFLLQREVYDRPPQTFTLVIPAGAGEQVAAGKDPVGVPEEMIFVVGDKLVVVNQDSVAHELGPIYVPPGATGSMVMDVAENLAYSCSFQSDGYLGLDVRRATTLTTRLIGLGLTAPTLGILIFLYSLVALPVKRPSLIA